MSWYNKKGCCNFCKIKQERNSSARQKQPRDQNLRTRNSCLLALSGKITLEPLCEGDDTFNMYFISHILHYTYITYQILHIHFRLNITAMLGVVLGVAGSRACADTRKRTYIHTSYILIYQMIISVSKFKTHTHMHIAAEYTR